MSDLIPVQDRPTRWRLALLGSLVLALVACGNSSSPPVTPNPSGVITPTPTPNPTPDPTPTPNPTPDPTPTPNPTPDPTPTPNPTPDPTPTPTPTPTPPDTTPPARPAGLQVTPGTVRGTLEVKWSANTESDLRRYTVTALPVGAGNQPAPLLAEHDQTSATLTGLSDATSYQVFVDAEDEAGNHSAKAGPVVAKTLTLSAPTLRNYEPKAASGVARSTDIALDFGEAMDRASVQGALTLSINGSVRSFTSSWNPDSRLVRISPVGGFANGNNVLWTLGTGARNAAGTALSGSVNKSFRIIQARTVTLLPNAALTKTLVERCRDPKLLQQLCGSRTYNTRPDLLIGDGYDDDLYTHHAYLTFSTASLPSSAAIVSAQLNLPTVSSKVGQPLSLGPVTLERVSFGTTLSATYASFATPRLGVVSAPLNATPHFFNVTDFVRKDWDLRASLNHLSEMRLSIIPNTNWDKNRDYMIYENPTLTVSYEYP